MSSFEIIADLSIPLRFDGPQPNAFGVEPATAEACEYGDLVGDTRRGGSCNFERVTFIPHCNGTHTECVGHITDERISVRDCLKDVLIKAVLVSVKPDVLDKGDAVISDTVLLRSGLVNDASHDGSALIIRTLPNDASKLSLRYDENNIPPYFSQDAMRLIVTYGFTHLLTDLPSIDRLFDYGKLANHRIFWNIEPGSVSTHTAMRMYSTITELIFVPDEVADGEYLLNLQIAPFDADAAPSRPLLLR